MVIPFNRQPQLLKSFKPSMSAWGIPLCNIRLSLFPPPFSLCPCRKSEPLRSWQRLQRRQLIFHDKALSSVRKETLSKPGLPFITENLFFGPALLSHTSALKSCPPKLPPWQGETNGLTSGTELRPLCPENDACCWPCGQKRKIYYTMRRYARWRGVFEFHTKRKRGVEDTLMATASARC